MLRCALSRLAPGGPRALRTLAVERPAYFGSRLWSSTDAPGVSSPQHLIADVTDGVGTITFDRPKVLNALSHGLMTEVVQTLEMFDADDNVRAIVVTGSEKSFAAGADVKEMAGKSFAEAYGGMMLSGWDRVASIRKPIVAAVNGFALGGGCEVAMMCDVVIAGDNAQFGQPEITLGVIPGMGGTQRLTRAVGKAKAMDMILTGRRMGAEEAERAGLVSRVVPREEVVAEAVAVARAIAKFSRPVTAMAKECVNAAEDLPLREGVRLERRLFHSAFALEDQKEGMGAFADKRPPEFRDR